MVIVYSKRDGKVSVKVFQDYLKAIIEAGWLEAKGDLVFVDDRRPA